MRWRSSLQCTSRACHGPMCFLGKTRNGTYGQSMATSVYRVSRMRGVDLVCRSATGTVYGIFVLVGIVVFESRGDNALYARNRPFHMDPRYPITIM